MSETSNQLRLTVITGLSGSGISTAINALEDLGHFCVDNLPPPLLRKLIDLAENNERFDKLSSDSMRGMFRTSKAPSNSLHLGSRGHFHRYSFLEASDDVLLRRFSVSRRPHPLGKFGLPIAEAIQTERLIMHPVRERANQILDSSDLNVHECKRLVRSFATANPGTLLFPR